MDHKQKAAFLIGMVRAFESAGWPEHFSEDDRAMWIKRAKWAAQMLTGGVFNPLNACDVLALVDDELQSFVDS